MAGVTGGAASRGLEPRLPVTLSRACSHTAASCGATRWWRRGGVWDSRQGAGLVLKGSSPSAPPNSVIWDLRPRCRSAVLQVLQDLVAPFRTLLVEWVQSCRHTSICPWLSRIIVFFTSSLKYWLFIIYYVVFPQNGKFFNFICKACQCQFS